MTPLRQAIDDYIALRRSLGFKLRRMSEGLQEFAVFLEQRAAPYVTTELAMEWAMLPTHHQQQTHARRFPRQGYSRFGHNAPDHICIRNRRFKSC